jgi:hypothetical protein
MQRIWRAHLQSHRLRTFKPSGNVPMHLVSLEKAPLDQISLDRLANQP